MNHGTPTTSLDSPSPEQVADYLNHRGWRREPRNWRDAQVWTPPEGAYDQILLPLELRYRDDHALVLRALHTIARAEGSDYRDILRLVREPLVDTQYFRTHPPSPSGTVPLLSGIEMLDGVRNAFTLAAQTVFDPRPKLSRGRNIKAVDDFLRQVRLGPTEAGSYILSAEVPLSPRRTDRLFEETPSERLVVLAMRKAISAAHHATTDAENSADLGAFDEAMEFGVSARLCESLAKFGGHDHDQMFSIEFQWSPAHEEAGDPSADSLEFSHRSAAILSRASARLRELEFSGAVRLTGTIVAMERQSPQHDGFVKVRGTLAMGEEISRERTLLVRLRPNAYTAALTAHAGGESFEVEGRLSSSGHRRELVPHRVVIADRIIE